MIQNISDRRTRPYRWLHVDAIAEPTWHDNSCPDSDQAPRDDREPGYAAKKNISLADAVNWVAAMPVPMTLYIYDGGSDTIYDVPWPPLDQISN
jgi:hypothetical protein